MLAAEVVTNSTGESSAHAQAEVHRALMGRIAASQDRAAFEELFAYFAPRVKAVMLKSGADSGLAEDLVQDVMMTVWRKVALYAPERGSVSAWVFTIARNARIDRMRRGASRTYEDVHELEIAADSPTAEDEALSNQQAEQVSEALDKLPDEQRRIIELAYINDMPQSQIAETLALPLGTVKSRMRLAYEKMRVSLEEMK